MASITDMLREFLSAYTNGISTVTAIDDLNVYSGDINVPGADSQILTVNPVAGTYKITIYLNIAGTSAAADRPNVSLRIGPAAGSNNAATTEKLRLLSTLNSTTNTFQTRLTLRSEEHT